MRDIRARTLSLLLFKPFQFLCQLQLINLLQLILQMILEMVFWEPPYIFYIISYFLFSVPRSILILFS